MRILITLLTLAVSCYGAGQVSQSLTPIGPPGVPPGLGNVQLVFTWKGDASNGTVPTTQAQLSGLPGGVQGSRILQVEVVPGTPAPTNGYAVALLDPFGADVMAGALGSLSATAAQFFSASSVSPPVTSFSLQITGQNVANAAGKVIVFLGPVTFVTATAGATGPAGPAGPSGQAINPNVVVVDGTTYPFTSAGLQSAINAACALSPAGGEVVIPPNTTITISSQVNINCSDLYLHGSGKTSKLVWATSASAVQGVTIQGVTGVTSASFNAQGNEGDSTIALVPGGVAALGLAVGDYILIQNTAFTLVQMSKVMGIAADVVTLSESLAETFTLAAGAKAVKISTPLKRIHISDLMLDGTANTNSGSHGIGGFSWFDGEISDIWCVKTGGSCVITNQGHGNTVRKLKMYQCSNSVTNADFYPNRETGMVASDILSEGAAFGPTPARTNHSKFYAIQSDGSLARGVKLATASHNQFFGVKVFNFAAGFTGFSFETGSHNNQVYGIEIPTNPADNSLAFFADTAGNSNNLVVGGLIQVLRFETGAGTDPSLNTVRDVRVLAANGISDATPRTAGNAYGPARSKLFWGCTGTATPSSTIFLAGFPPTTCTTTTRAIVQEYMVPSVGGVLRNLNVFAGTGGVNASSGVCTIIVGGVLTPLTVTLGTGTNAQDSNINHSYTVNPGGVALTDHIGCQCTTQAADTLANIQCSVDII